MGIIHGVVLIPPGGNIPKGTGVDKLPSPERSLKNFTVPLTAVKAPGTKAAGRHHAGGTVTRPGSVIAVRSLQIHISLLSSLGPRRFVTGRINLYYKPSGKNNKKKSI
jgi:hypothetical protein